MTVKKTQVVMLPTNEKVKKGQLTFFGRKLVVANSILHLAQVSQHLYFLSDDEIKEGDWCYHSGRRIITQWFNRPGSYKEKDALRKIIATTDNSLGLPQHSQSFIQKYIEEYNKGNVIEWVDVEYDTSCKTPLKKRSCFCGLRNVDCENQKGIKINSNNEITIKPIKDNLIDLIKKNPELKEEVIKLIKQSFIEGGKCGMNFNRNFDLDKWISENI